MALVIDDTLISNVADNLRAAMTTDPKMRKVIQQHIREALFEARRQVMSSSPLQNDPRGAIRSVRTSVYKEVLGGNINILTGERQKAGAHGTNSYTPQRTLTPGQRGGNRRKRSERTKQIQGYAPLDRGFILRWVNSGTKTRVIGFRNTQKGNRTRYENRVYRINRGDKANTGNRGAIAPRNWFERAAESALGTALASITEMIEIEAAAIARGES